MFDLNKLMFLVVILTITGCAGKNISPNATTLDVSFSWAETKRCSSISPAIFIKGYPAETTEFEIRLRDNDVPGWSHGGGKYANDNTGTVPAGALKVGYNGPCPPSGSHRYEFTVNAIDKEGVIVGTGKSMNRFP